MYGTIAKLNVKPEKVKNFKESMKEDLYDYSPKGYKNSYLYQMDSNENEFYLTVVFENEDAYNKNAESEETNKHFKNMMNFLESEPDWHDGKIIHAVNF